MTDRAYKAKCWLNRNFGEYKKVEAERRVLETIEDRLFSGTASYYNDGTQGNADASNKRREDNLIEYTEQRAKLDKAVRALARKTQETRDVIDQLDDPTHQAIAIDRYIARLPWKRIMILEHVSRATLFRHHDKMLNEVGEILGKRAKSKK